MSLENDNKKDALQYRKELTKPAPKIFPKRKVLVFGKNDIWSADIVDYNKLSAFNSQYKYLLCIIDIYSRYAYVFPLRDKKGISIMQCFKELKDNIYGKNLWVDQGGEFLNRDFKNFCLQHDINMYHTYGEGKAVYVERFNRTLKTRINNYFIENNTNVYIDILPKLVNDYNNSIHSSIGKTPASIYIHDEKPLNKNNMIDNSKIVAKYKEGDYVRISKVKGIFEKGYSHKWSKEVFKIIKVNTLQHPIMYQLEDLQKERIEGKFYEQEVQKTELKDYTMIEDIVKTRMKNGKKEYLVKYDGYSEKFNEWVDSSKVVMRN